MAIKTHLLIFLSVAIVALSIANAQNFPGTNPVIGPERVIINGTLYCTLNGGLIGGNVSATPPFPDALVQLRGSAGQVFASTITGPNGALTINFIPSPLVLAALLTGEAQLYVVTPPAQCNSTLPSDRRLVSTGLRLRGFINLLTVLITPDGFTLSRQV